ncbi:MAG: PLP-dependent aspartate aminotransferase family protein [Bryobacterales bacterium]|nr:PLP-dependent aspartate aminotransferase family protein [Bryobacterales bacterium]
MKIDTLAVHAGDRKKLGNYVPSTTPVFGTSSFFYERTEDLDRVFNEEIEGHGYTRYGNPTTAALEELLARLEGGDLAVATTSGMSAIHLALIAAMTDRRRSVLCAKVMYGQSITLLTNILGPTGVDISFAEPCDLDDFEQVLAKEKPSCVLLEPVSNPLLRVAPIDRITTLAHAHGASVIVDNTFATPVLLRPLELGVDLVVHSMTKYLAGHGDLMGGALVASEDWRQLITVLTRTLGPNIGPFEAYLAMRGIKTLPLRIERQCQNARHIAAWLKGHPRVKRVYFPGDPEHPDIETSRRLFPRDLFGGMVSFEIKDAGRQEVFAFMDALRMIVPATTLGDVHSLMLYPAISSHRDLAPKHRERLGIRDNLVRLSAGIEAVEDIEADLDQALKR